LALPAIVGNIAGSMAATTVSDTIFTVCMTVVMSAVLIYMIFEKSHKHPHIHGGHPLVIKPLHYLWFLLLGFYGGYIYIGLGYAILIVTIWSMDLDIVTANVLKGFIIFIATPFSLIIFMLDGQVDYAFGLWHGLGNVLGAMFASYIMIVWGIKFVRYFTILVLLVCFADLLGLISLESLIQQAFAYLK
jgi:uncharacterized membrane protein YfcA